MYFNLQESETLLERWKNKQMSDLLEIHNKQPTWSEGERESLEN